LLGSPALRDNVRLAVRKAKAERQKMVSPKHANISSVEMPSKLSTLITQVTNKEDGKKAPLNSNMTPQAKRYSASL